MGDFPRKILVSPGFGAGWSTWHEGNTKFVCEYQPIIDFLEDGGQFVELTYRGPEDDPAAMFAEPGATILRKFLADLAEHEGKDKSHFYLGGADDLVVVTVYAPYLIEEYDGNEYVRTQADPDFIS